MKKYFPPIPEKEIRAASEAAYAEYYAHMGRIRQKGKEYLALAQRENLPVIILSGRPYHLDREVNHGIDKLICECGAVVVTEDSVSDQEAEVPHRGAQPSGPTTPGCTPPPNTWWTAR